jgi:hypothetical protein
MAVWISKADGVTGAAVQETKNRSARAENTRLFLFINIPSLSACVVEPLGIQ